MTNPMTGDDYKRLADRLANVLRECIPGHGNTIIDSFSITEAEMIATALRLAAEPVKAGEPVALTYTNYRGETAARRIIPRSIRFGSTEWHPEPQWLLLAFDIDKQADREFALKDFGAPASDVLREAVMASKRDKILNDAFMLAWDEFGDDKSTEFLVQIVADRLSVEREEVFDALWNIQFDALWNIHGQGQGSRP